MQAARGVGPPRTSQDSYVYGELIDESYLQVIPGEGLAAVKVVEGALEDPGDPDPEGLYSSLPLEYSGEQKRAPQGSAPRAFLIFLLSFLRCCVPPLSFGPPPSE